MKRFPSPDFRDNSPLLFLDQSPTDRADRGERTAAAMENKLSALEQKIDELLASVDQQGGQGGANTNPKTSSKESKSS